MFSDNNIGLNTFVPYESMTPGILVINKASEQVYNFLIENSQQGLARILILDISEDEVLKTDGWDLLNAGAADILKWENGKIDLENIVARINRWKAVNSLLNSDLVTKNLIGQSNKWRLALCQIIETAYFTETPILITGESGTGKEIVARLIHTLDQRKNKQDLVVVDCTTIVPELSGSEFFGHERDAFTGAASVRDGAFALANNGSLFLDEVGELPLRLQAELLRVVQEQTYKKVGANNWETTKFRLISATNRELMKMQEEGKFRSDFYYRIACWKCKLPAIRERREDIIPLAEYFVKEFCKEKEPPRIDDSVLEYLSNREYPGNIRDLKQLIYRIMCSHVGNGTLTIGSIPVDERPSVKSTIRNNWYNESTDAIMRRAIQSGIGLKEISRTVESAVVRIAVNDENGNLQRAAIKLGVTDRALQIRRASGRFN